MLQKFIVVALLSARSLQTVAKELAITLDDLPRFAHGGSQVAFFKSQMPWRKRAGRGRIDMRDISGHKI